MQINNSFDPLTTYILLNSDPLVVVQWQEGILAFEELLFKFGERLIEQNYYRDQSYIPNTIQLSPTMSTQSLVSSLATSSSVQTPLHAEIDQDPMIEYIPYLSPALPFQGNQGLLCMNGPKGANLSSKTSVAVGCSVNENRNTLPDYNIQEIYVNDFAIHKSGNDISLDVFNCQVVNEETYYQSSGVPSFELPQTNNHSHVTQGVTDSAFGNTGSPPSSTCSIPNTYVCCYCGHSSTRYYNLRSHIATHFRDRPKVISCEVCPKKYFRVCDMRRHYKIHHLGQKFGCFCGKIYARKDVLKRHHKKHLSEYNLA